METVAIETLHVLDGGQQARGVGLDQHKDQDGHEVVGGGDGSLVGQTEEVHDGLGAAEHALQLVFGSLGFENTEGECVRKVILQVGIQVDVLPRHRKCKQVLTWEMLYSLKNIVCLRFPASIQEVNMLGRLLCI